MPLPEALTTLPTTVLAIAGVTLPFFALVGLGWLGARQGLLPLQAVPGLNSYVLFFALPAMLFRAGQGLPVRELLDPVLLTVYLAVALALVALVVGLTRPAVGLRDAAFGALVAAFPNTGFMGLPLLAALLGPASAGPVITSMLADLFITSSLCIALAQWQGAGQHGARHAALKALRGALSNPLPWAIAAGALASASGWALPAPAQRIVGLLADSASPVALFTIGAVLWRAGRIASAHASEHPGPSRAVAPVVLTKLLLHPALVALGCLAARAAGAPLTGFQALVLTLAAALPSASNVSLLTERYGADTGRVVRIILWSTVLAFASFTLLAAGLGVKPAAV